MSTEMQATVNACGACGFSCSHLNPSPYFAFCCIMPDPYPEKDDTVAHWAGPLPH